MQIKRMYMPRPSATKKTTVMDKGMKPKFPPKSAKPEVTVMDKGMKRPAYALARTLMAKGGMVKANCGASMKPTQKGKK